MDRSNTGLVTAALRGAIVITMWCCQAAPARAEIIAENGSAIIAQDVAAGTWSVTAAGATLTMRLAASSDFAIVKLASPSGQLWTTAIAPDTSLTVNGRTLPFGNASAGFAFITAGVTVDGPRLRLDAVYDLRAAGLRVTRHYVVTDGTPTFETWTTIQGSGISANNTTVSDLNGFQLTVPAGRIHWLTGLQGDNSDVSNDSAFTLRSQELDPGDQFEQDAQGRASERVVPWFAIESDHDAFFTTLLWSGAWSFTADRTDAGLALAFGLGPMTATVDNHTTEGPHVVFGVTPGNMWNASDALRTYTAQALRFGRPITPLVTFNTWYAYGTHIDQDTLRDAMVRASALGAELFVVDAGWYTGAGSNGTFDFDTGLGTWEVDPARFPDGLASLRDYAHSLGLKFGLWVEPERVSLATVGQPDLAQEDWLATAAGTYGSADSAQVCLANAAGRQWVVAKLTQLIDSVQPDYLKWDNNFWINCDRPGHDHGDRDGNYRHVSELYSVLEALRLRYPDLQIENVSGGGNRLDLGMLRYSDVAWMDDRTAPSVHVRHNLQGLSAVFPPAYLLSFVLNTAEEPLTRAPDLALYFRSRMMGTLGLSFIDRGFSSEDISAIQREIAINAAMRDSQSSAVGRMLTAQARVTDGPGWDVFQETGAGGQQILILAVQSDPGVTTFTVKPKGLASDTLYEVRSADTGVLGTESGDELEQSGIDVTQGSSGAAHLLILTAQPQAAAPATDPTSASVRSKAR
jgi:alpha-galactosidase